MGKTFNQNKKRYYTAKADATSARRKGDRIYYSDKLRAYYIVRPTKSSWKFYFISLFNILMPESLCGGNLITISKRLVFIKTLFLWEKISKLDFPW